LDGNFITQSPIINVPAASEEEEVGKSEKKKKKGNGERNVTWKRIELGKRLKGSEEN